MNFGMAIGKGEAGRPIVVRSRLVNPSVRMRVEETFSLEQLAARHLLIYKSLIDNPA